MADNIHLETLHRGRVLLGGEEKHLVIALEEHQEKEVGFHLEVHQVRLLEVLLERLQELVEGYLQVKLVGEAQDLMLHEQDS